MTVESGPRPTSTWDSMTTPDTSALGIALSSKTSGPRWTWAAVHLGLDDDSRHLGLGVRLELQDIGLEDDHLEQVIQARPLHGRHRHRDRFPSPVLRRYRSEE